MAAVARAHHLLYRDGPIVFEDPYALQLIGPTWRRIVSSQILRWIVFRKLLWSLRPASAQILARARYAEDCLDAAIESGIRQFIIVGAGLDSFALRRRDIGDAVTVLELDHPSTQQIKRFRLRHVAPDLPRYLEFVPIDFEHEALCDALIRSSFDYQRPAFFSWLGTTHYLTNDATLATLRSLTTCASRNSELVFDYSVPNEMIPASEVEFVRRLERFTVRRGEPMIGKFAPHELARQVQELGWAVLENVSGEEQGARYFAGYSDPGFRPPASAYLVHLRLEG